MRTPILMCFVISQVYMNKIKKKKYKGPGQKSEKYLANFPSVITLL